MKEDFVMMKAVNKVIFSTALAVMTVAMLAGPARAEEKKVELGGATSAAVAIKMGGDSLKVGSGAQDLMNGDFTYNPKSPPEFSYALLNGRGSLSIKPGASGPVAKRVGNQWDLKLNNTVPIDLNVDFSTGTCELGLAGLTLTALKLEAFSGDASLDLAGSHPVLPKFGVTMDYGTLSVSLKGDYAQLSAFDIALTSGVLNVDLGGKWHQNAAGVIKSGNATTVINLPKDVGVMVEVKNAKGVTAGPGITSQTPGGFVTEAYGVAPVTLKVTVENRKGLVSLELSE
jgi:hypothetical protein